MRDGQTNPHSPRVVVSRSTCPPISPSPPTSSFVIGTSVINTHTRQGTAVIHTVANWTLDTLAGRVRLVLQ